MASEEEDAKFVDELLAGEALPGDGVGGGDNPPPKIVL